MSSPIEVEAFAAALRFFYTVVNGLIMNGF